MACQKNYFKTLLVLDQTVQEYFVYHQKVFDPLYLRNKIMFQIYIQCKDFFIQNVSFEKEFRYYDE